MPINYSLYHPKWSLISYKVRFKRAGGKCEQCGAQHLRPHPVSGYRVVLAAIHLDQDRDNNEFSNLAAFCQSCHLRHDASTHSYSRRYGREISYQNGVLFLLDKPVVSIRQVKRTYTPLRLFDQDLSGTLQWQTLFDPIASCHPDAPGS